MGNCISVETNSGSNSRGTARATASSDGVFQFGADALAMLVKPNAQQQQAKRTRASNSVSVSAQPPSVSFTQEVSEAIPATVRMFSGCMDAQTSADVSDVASFGLPPVSAAEKAGGACTNGLLMTLKQNGDDMTFGDLIVGIQKNLKQRGYEQIPQLSSSNGVSLKNEKFSVMNPNPNGRTRALLIGINYVGHSQGVLNGCVNDALMMRNYLVSKGYKGDEANMRLLADDQGVSKRKPTGAEIVAGLRWVVDGAQAGDSLFVHYSGHGSQVKDKTGDEVDGMDEVLVPVDYDSSGMITDDTLFQLLISNLPKGVHLVLLFDCCHSGSILDLPFMFSATNENVQQYESSGEQDVQLQQNPGFNLEMVKQLAIMAAQGVLNQVLKSQVATSAKSVGGGLVQGGTLQGALFDIAKSCIKIN